MSNIPNDVLETIKIAVHLRKPIEVLDLDTRPHTCLRRYGIKTVADLCEAYVEGKLPKIRGMGGKSLYEVEYLLGEYLKKCGIWREVDE